MKKLQWVKTDLKQKVFLEHSLQKTDLQGLFFVFLVVYGIFVINTLIHMGIFGAFFIVVCLVGLVQFIDSLISKYTSKNTKKDYVSESEEDENLSSK